MIKLEELKTGDKIYAICSSGLGLYQESIVMKELFMLDSTPPCEVVWCKGGLDLITRNYEDYIFRTHEEAEEYLMNLRQKLAKELLKSDKFIERLYECATSSKRLDKYSERPIYELAIEMYKQNMK